MSSREIQITVDQFLGAFKDTNPFAKNKVTEVGDAEADVPGIHSDSFAKLTKGIEKARRNRVSTGIMLLGGAGLGKSHLLARLSQWALSDRHAVMIFLHNVIASPEQMARYVLRAALSSLAGHRPDAYCESGLYRLINQGIEGQLRSEGKQGVPTTQVRLKALGQIARGGIEDASAVKAFAAFLHESIAATGGEPGAEMRAAAAVEWLAGEVIENELAAHLGLPQGDDQKMVVTDQRIESVFRASERCPQKQKARIYDLKLRERRSDAAEVTTGVVFVTSANKTSVASVLKHLADDPLPPDHRVLVTDEERRPLPLGPKGKEHFDKLSKLGVSRFEHVRLTFDEYAHLDALAGLLGSARVGDFEVDHPPGETRSVSEGEAVASLHRQAKFVSHRLLREFLTEEAAPLPAPEPEKPAIDATSVRATIQEHLAWRLGLTTRELTRLVIDKEPMFKNRFDDVHEQIRTIASKMHDERLLFATAQDEQMFLQLSGAR